MKKVFAWGFFLPSILFADYHYTCTGMVSGPGKLATQARDMVQAKVEIPDTLEEGAQLWKGRAVVLDNIIGVFTIEVIDGNLVGKAGLIDREAVTVGQTVFAPGQEYVAAITTGEMTVAALEKLRGMKNMVTQVVSPPVSGFVCKLEN